MLFGQRRNAARPAARRPSSSNYTTVEALIGLPEALDPNFRDEAHRTPWIVQSR